MLRVGQHIRGKGEQGVIKIIPIELDCITFNMLAASLLHWDSISVTVTHWSLGSCILGARPILLRSASNQGTVTRDTTKLGSRHRNWIGIALRARSRLVARHIGISTCWIRSKLRVFSLHREFKSSMSNRQRWWGWQAIRGLHIGRSRRYFNAECHRFHFSYDDDFWSASIADHRKLRPEPLWPDTSFIITTLRSSYHAHWAFIEVSPFLVEDVTTIYLYYTVEETFDSSDFLSIANIITSLFSGLMASLVMLLSLAMFFSGTVCESCSDLVGGVMLAILPTAISLYCVFLASFCVLGNECELPEDNRSASLAYDFGSYADFLYGVSLLVGALLQFYVITGVPSFRCCSSCCVYWPTPAGLRAEGTIPLAPW